MSSPEYQKYLDVQSLVRGIAPRPDRTSTRELAPLVKRLCGFYQVLKAEQAKQPAVFKPGGEWAAALRQQQHLYEPLLSGNVSASTDLLKNFWRNDLGSIVKQYMGFSTLQNDSVAREHFADLMAHDFMIWRNLVTEPTRNLAVTRIGHAWGYYVDGVLVAPKALRYHLLAQQIKDLVSDVKHPVVAEIGAGYGGAANFLLRGRASVTYIDFDLPEVLVIAAYYLIRTLSHRQVVLYERGMKLSRTKLSRNSVVLMPNWMIGALPARSVDVFVNTFSLSEMPMPVIRNYLQHIERSCRGYFLYNNMDRPGVVNRGHERVPCSKYPFSPGTFKQLYKRYDLFQRMHSGRNGDYREVLLERL